MKRTKNERYHCTLTFETSAENINFVYYLLGHFKRKEDGKEYVSYCLGQPKIPPFASLEEALDVAEIFRNGNRETRAIVDRIQAHKVAHNTQVSEEDLHPETNSTEGDYPGSGFFVAFLGEDNDTSVFQVTPKEQTLANS